MNLQIYQQGVSYESEFVYCLGHTKCPLYRINKVTTFPIVCKSMEMAFQIKQGVVDGCSVWKVGFHCIAIVKGVVLLCKWRLLLNLSSSIRRSVDYCLRTS